MREDEGMPEPCQPIGCDNGYHIRGCAYDTVDDLVEQPMPIPNSNPSVHDLVTADIAERRRIGLERYNSLLQAHNGRDALWDAYEEVLDLACYLRQAIEERKGSKETAAHIAGVMDRACGFVAKTTDTPSH